MSKWRCEEEPKVIELSDGVQSKNLKRDVSAGQANDFMNETQGWEEIWDQ